MMDFLVQFAVAGVVVGLVVLLVVTQERRATLRERMLHAGTRRHWWNRPRNGR